MKVIIKWSGREYPLELGEADTVATLRDAIYVQTGVRPERQKLLNLNYKGKVPEDEFRVLNLKLKPGGKIMMVGSLEEDINEVNAAPDDLPEVVNDLEFEEKEISISKDEIYLAKIERRIKEYKITMLNDLRPDKKLLVLDIDYTLFDHRSTAETGAELMRPYLHEFLTSAYEDYNIVIWSATSMKWIQEKMKLLGVSSHPDYKISFYLDCLAMISVHSQEYGIMDVKPLKVIWGKFSQFSPKNTIMFDDIRRNFIMNPKNGLRIKAFRQAHLNRGADDELLKLSKYLKDLAKHCSDFTTVDHRKWYQYNPRGRE